MNDKISMRLGYTLSFNEDGTFFLKVETKEDTLEFDGVKGNIIIASEPWDEDNMTEMTFDEMVKYTREFFTDWGIEYEVTEALVKDLTPWFKEYAADKAEAEEPDAWEEVLLKRIEEEEIKAEMHKKAISRKTTEFKEWVSDASETDVVGEVVWKAQQIVGAYETYKAVWKRLMEAKSELEQYREAMGR